MTRFTFIYGYFHNQFNKNKLNQYLPKHPISIFGRSDWLQYLAISKISIYHTSEYYFWRTLIGQLGGDQPSTIHPRAAEEKRKVFPFHFGFKMSQIKLLFGLLVIQLVWYILKLLFTSVSVKLVDICRAANFYFGEQLLNIN